MTDAKKKLPRWTFTHSWWRTGVVFSVALHWHKPSETSWWGVDAALGLGVVSLYLSYRHRRPEK